MNHLIILINIFIIVFTSIIQPRLLHSPSISNSCPEYFKYNDQEDTCDIDIPLEYGDVTIDDLTGHCIDENCPEGHRCIDRDNAPYCVKLPIAIQEAIKYYEGREL
uniref:Uncharacterized protein n=1 Tax=Strongyloides venezuelensis TaxID=75913 RepID=A0A0K0EWH3_STRVS